MEINGNEKEFLNRLCGSKNNNETLTYEITTNEDRKNIVLYYNVFEIPTIAILHYHFQGKLINKM